MRDMIEYKKVLQEKLDTLKNVIDSLTKSMSIKKFYWHREIVGIISLDFLSCTPTISCVQRNNKWDNFGYPIHYFHNYPLAMCNRDDKTLPCLRGLGAIPLEIYFGLFFAFIF